MCSVLQSSEGLCEASTLCKYNRINDDFFFLRWARVWRCALVSDAFEVLIEGVIACISLFIFLVLRYVVTVVVCMRFMWCVIRHASCLFCCIRHTLVVCGCICICSCWMLFAWVRKWNWKKVDGIWIWFVMRLRCVCNGSIFVSSCRYLLLVSSVQPVAIWVLRFVSMQCLLWVL